MVALTFFWRAHTFYGVLACAGALLFHMSAAAMFPTLLFQPTKRWQVIVLGFGAFSLVLTAGNFISNYLGNYIAVFSEYQIAGYGDVAPNPLSAPLLLDWLMIAVSLTLWDLLSLSMKRIVFIQIIGMAIFYGAFDFPVIAHRIREMYSVFWIFFVADGMRVKTMRIPAGGFVVASIGLYSYFFIFGTFFE